MVLRNTADALLDQRGPPHDVPSLAQSRAYCRRLARSHYENFTVASWLLPRRLRQHFYNLYAYCRLADDLADELPEQVDSGRDATALLPLSAPLAMRRLELLADWEEQLRACYRGEARHEVFVALHETIQEFSIPIEPLADLLVAFRQDQTVARYQTVEQLLEYCRYSAQPVGRLVLYLGECHDEPRGRLADAICTGLQWANFCQDVARDWERGRIYLPQESCRAHGYDEAMFARRECNQAFRHLLAAEVDRAAGWLEQGRPLVDQVPGWLRVDVALFIEGGLAILQAIRRVDYDVWNRRPEVGKLRQLRLLAHCWWKYRVWRAEGVRSAEFGVRS